MMDTQDLRTIARMNGVETDLGKMARELLITRMTACYAFEKIGLPKDQALFHLAGCIEQAVPVLEKELIAQFPAAAGVH